MAKCAHMSEVTLRPKMRYSRSMDAGMVSDTVLRCATSCSSPAPVQADGGGDNVFGREGPDGGHAHGEVKGPVAVEHPNAIPRSISGHLDPQHAPRPRRVGWQRGQRHPARCATPRPDCCCVSRNGVPEEEPCLAKLIFCKVTETHGYGVVIGAMHVPGMRLVQRNNGQPAC